MGYEKECYNDKIEQVKTDPGDRASVTDNMKTRHRDGNQSVLQA